MGKVPRGSAFHNLEATQEVVPQGISRAAAKAEFANRLQRAMIQKGWNQSELSRRATLQLGKHIGRDSISQYIRGSSFPSPEKLHALCKVLGVEPADLVPAKGVKSASDRASPFEIRDIGEGMVWLSINQAVPKGIGMQILSILGSI